MSKPASIQITIPSPCSQNWDEMIQGDTGRHCTHCQKTVIDFTSWSDANLYIISFLKIRSLFAAGFYQHN